MSKKLGLSTTVTTDNVRNFNVGDLIKIQRPRFYTRLKRFIRHPIKTKWKWAFGRNPAFRITSVESSEIEMICEG